MRAFREIAMLCSQRRASCEPGLYRLMDWCSSEEIDYIKIEWIPLSEDGVDALPEKLSKLAAMSR